ncbi:hypothetical protein C0Q70_03424 [Pomacea canaliculata]|uniref:Pyruvate kinase n=1 Tax=Pomacea canaliculata TaxID=400727 RepID=A0A2T7PSS0_POMCA|nr:pyruvate kinase PKM-like [Pomacea canaliculata]PVD36440.1 hypothetical protein C0Q70_03424 [Pomacea canaliculata]
MTTIGQSFANRYDSALTQLCGLDVDSGIRPFRMTPIICTIGPSCENIKIIAEMIEVGMNICRLNMAHGTFEYHSQLIKNVREAMSQTHSPSPVAIAVELGGQGVRCGCFLPELGEEVKFKKGDVVILTNEKELQDKCDRSVLYINSQYYLNLAKIGHKIWVGDGLLSFVVKEKLNHGKLRAEVDTEGEISNLDHCIIPRVPPAPTCCLTDYDKECIKFALAHNVDMIFASWVWSESIIKEIRSMLGDKGAKMKIIANIENYMGVKNFNEIVEAADGVMVARGDLGMDLPPEKVFLAQKNMIGRANVAGKPVICAAQMLDSMVKNPRPTRAEAGDVANAILDGADCIMLSRETAAGRYPVLALKYACAIAREAEMAVHHDRVYRQLRASTPLPVDSTHCTAISAVEASIRCQASAIIVVTNSGRSAGVVARYRPPCLIVAVTKSQHTVKLLHLHRGIYPVLHDAASCGEWIDDIDFRINHALIICKRRGYVKAGDYCILVTGSMEGPGWTNTVRTISVPDQDTLTQKYVNLVNQTHLNQVIDHKES